MGCGPYLVFLLALLDLCTAVIGNLFCLGCFELSSLCLSFEVIEENLCLLCLLKRDKIYVYSVCLLK